MWNLCGKRAEPVKIMPDGVGRDAGRPPGRRSARRAGRPPEHGLLHPLVNPGPGWQQQPAPDVLQEAHNPNMALLEVVLPADNMVPMPAADEAQLQAGEEQFQLLAQMAIALSLPAESRMPAR